MRAVFAIPGNINIRNGGYGYNRQMLSLMPAFGIAASHLQLPASLPQGPQSDMNEAARLMAHVPRDQVLLVDSLGYSCLSSSLIQTIAAPVVALVHHPLSAELGLAGSAARICDETERVALSLAKAIVVSSPYTAAQLMRDFGVPADKLTVAVPGTAAAKRALGSGSKSCVQLLCVGSLIARKGYEFLLEALAELQQFDWHLTIAGSQSLDAPYAQRLIGKIQASPLAQRITMHDEIPAAALDELYHHSDVFLMPSLFEGYGMALAEAMARGLPIVCTTGGAAAQTVPDGAGLKVPPADAPALKQALKMLFDSPALRAKIADKSWQEGQKLPDWPASAKIIADIVKNARVAF